MIEETDEEQERGREEARRALAKRRNERSRRELRRLVGHLESENELLHEQLEHALDLKSYEPQKYRLKKRTKKDAASGMHRCVPILLASDWHMGEKIRPSTVNGMNEFNPEIAQERAWNYWLNAHRLIDTQRGGAIIDSAVLWMGGDLMDGRLHPDAEDNWLSPIEETHLVVDTFRTGIDYLLENADLRTIHIVTNQGNHGRTNAKERRVSTSALHSYEFSIYHQLRNHYAFLVEKGLLEKGRVTWDITEGPLNWIELPNDIHIRTSHGDNVGYSGGVGGLTIPINKAIHQWNTVPTPESLAPRHATYDLFGHWHQYTPSARFLINGSLCGWNAYSISIKAAFEQPCQAFVMADLDTKTEQKIIGHFPIRVI